MEKVAKLIEQNALVLRLERNQREVGQLKNKLKSYVCEPKTYSFYERIESLKHRLENLSSTNNEILRTLKDKRRTVEDYVESVRKQLNEFHDLQQGVADYVRGARSC